VPTAYLCPLVYIVIVLFYNFLENKVAVVEASYFVILQKKKQISSGVRFPCAPGHMPTQTLDLSEELTDTNGAKHRDSRSVCPLAPGKKQDV
jgi:hypothetical protein